MFADVLASMIQVAHNTWIAERPVQVALVAHEVQVIRAAQLSLGMDNGLEEGAER
jgi:hypothetical protein